MNSKRELHKAVVAMSGGVDSSVAALLLQQSGWDALGVSMQVWDYRQNGGCESKATCCSPDDFTDARSVAARVGIPYYVFDFEQNFREQVIDNFVAKYQQGLTPNPCIDCNRKVKFKELRERAAALGCSHVATGHYAQIEKREDGYHLLRGSDAAKDQSYFLYGLSQQELAATLFPVGHLLKDEVRELAKEAGLPTASKPESQDICFVSGSVQEFISRRSEKQKSGQLIDRQGQVLGQHDGIHQFTVGQRRGLHLGGGVEQPFYVLEIRPESNTIVVGKKEELERESFSVGEVTWVAPQVLRLLEERSEQRELSVIAQLRHRHQGVPVQVELKPAGNVLVRFTSEWSTVSPGQAAVFYDAQNQELLGGGRIHNAQLQQEASIAPGTVREKASQAGHI